MRYLNARNTPTGELLNIPDIETSIKKLIVGGNYELESPYQDVYALVGSDIPLFDIPIMIDYQGNVSAVVDIRPFKRNGNISNMSEYLMAVLSGVYAVQYYNNKGTLNNNLSYGGMLYSSVISHILAKTYSLDFVDQMKVRVVAAAMYVNLTSNDTDNNYIIAKLSDSTVDVVNDMARSLGDISSIEQMATAMKEVTSSVRLDRLNGGVLLNLMANVFLSYNSKRKIGVAMEYPPLWAAIAGSAIIDRRFKKSMMTTISASHTRVSSKNEMVRYVTDIIKTIDQ